MFFESQRSNIMFKYICLLVALISGSCNAKDNFLATSFDWLKSTLPDSTHLEFNKSKIKFDGCKHREYNLSLVQPVSENFSIESGVSYAKGKLSWGIHSQRISLRQYSFLPRFKFNNKISLSAGVIIQSAPEFKTSQGMEFELPKSKKFLISSRFKGLRDDHEIDIELSSHRWEATGETNSWFDRGLADNKLNISYAAYF